MADAAGAIAIALPAVQTAHFANGARMSERFSALTDLIYEGVSDAVPWQGFAEGLRVALGARNVFVTLHHADDDGHDIFVGACEPGDDVHWAAVESTYRAEFMEDDPFRPGNMAPGQLALLQPLRDSSRRHVLFEHLRIARGLRTCVAEPGGIKCWIDVIRGIQHPDPPFSAADLALMQALLPHLTRALGLYAQLKRLETEKAIYENMVEHFALGCILLNDEREIIHINRVASSIIERSPDMALGRRQLRLSDRSAQALFSEAIGKVISARLQAGSGDGGELVRLGGYQSRLIALLVYPAPLLHYYRGGQAPCAVIYLSDLTANLEALRPTHAQSLKRIGLLFGLTRQEAALALFLAYGNTIAEAAQQMGIAETAARNYSKKIYAKMGIASQADLIRLMLRSISFLR